MYSAVETEVKEPSISTLLMNFDSSFDPYGAMSTPLYQTATFKQASCECPYVVLYLFAILCIFVIYNVFEVRDQLY